MSDIFVSYARDDRPWVEKLASALSEQGWSIWWDRDLMTGEDFGLVIDRELSTARCVIAVWSTHASHSPWVRDEASRALQRGVLVPLRRDGAPIPLGFGQIHTADLSAWNGTTSCDSLATLTADIHKLLKDGPNVPIESHAAPRRKRRALLVAGLVVAAVLIGVFSIGGLFRASPRRRVQP